MTNFISLKRIVIILLVIFTFQSAAQNADESDGKPVENKFLNWYNKSPRFDTIYGADVERAYTDLLSNKESKTVIVAVIDGGVDITHEDLKDNIWVNEDEIPGNNMDDDQNGYIDDIHGWNYLGNDKGENISHENLEITRVYKQYNNKSQLKDKEKELYKKAKKSYEKELKRAKMQKNGVVKYKNKYFTSYNKIIEELDGKEMSLSNLDSLRNCNKELKKDIRFIYPFIQYGFKTEIFDEAENHFDEILNYHLNIDFNPREIIGDNVEELTPGYGNNNVYGPEADHGTFVSGIIAAKRNNNLGINGVASDVKIMALKTVPNGDERDKDVANAIRYAVDNGARIINMSFGKELSPQKHLVDEAALYAEKNGVLIVHAAGNDASDNDKILNYPEKYINNNIAIDTWITVGASTIKNDYKFVANFSNYGKKSVDLFAPGVDIYSLKPESEYETAGGTSFSSPIVSGVAALIMSYYPELSAKEVKEIILNSVNYYGENDVYLPGPDSKKRKTTKFKDLSVTGGLVNAYKAIELAESYHKK
ncbi:MAG: hypothetical protein A2X13_08355 [Bacteroidetes bacterium GWC2_33_15]|nr:MAG: hypothetical protein A2X10_10185 [Bacteroidetes bacterium GWA2_33_15]OFX51466.1 MAG: hypothetical protein A2X13_08355 [Bacteroidetes bacterium GWC2_33_15]OFX65788.1 MAG: hypothetical protein A2X15_13425 [Bacteroidetes bacterium GWB2_32_14]OFX69494.1 MAG: hypothetical protein A2X14_09935 [Bacteroidetes bacterium GWD2_33_33]HAN17751.1 peptidase S8 [Bacteroidales bacterium]